MNLVAQQVARITHRTHNLVGQWKGQSDIDKKEWIDQHYEQNQFSNITLNGYLTVPPQPNSLNQDKSRSSAGADENNISAPMRESSQITGESADAINDNST